MSVLNGYCPIDVPSNIRDSLDHALKKHDLEFSRLALSHATGSVVAICHGLYDLQLTFDGIHKPRWVRI